MFLRGSVYTIYISRLYHPYRLYFFDKFSSIFPIEYFHYELLNIQTALQYEPSLFHYLVFKIKAISCKTQLLMIVIF